MSSSCFPFKYPIKIDEVLSSDAIGGWALMKKRWTSVLLHKSLGHLILTSFPLVRISSWRRSSYTGGRYFMHRTGLINVFRSQVWAHKSGIMPRCFNLLLWGRASLPMKRNYGWKQATGHVEPWFFYSSVCSSSLWLEIKIIILPTYQGGWND